MNLPLVFKTENLRVLIVGGGDVAAHKMEILRSLGCELTVIAPQVKDSIRAGAVRWIEREYQAGDCRGFQLIIAATNRRELNRAVSDEAKALGVPVNVVDDPQLCTVIFPAVWRQGPLTVAVSTEGVAPFMAAAVRDRLAGQAGQLARWVELAGRFRAAVRAEVSDWDERKLLYREFMRAVKPDEALAAPAGTRLRDWMEWLNRAEEGAKIES
jgi:uroporphyrin-III C-methyltransferase / precorrin-2 dehydrogenase / sirohydrochlorin ferrochelatase